jgi:hypothetical protein
MIEVKKIKLVQFKSVSRKYILKFMDLSGMP